MGKAEARSGSFAHEEATLTSRKNRYLGLLAVVAMLTTSCAHKTLTQNALDPKGPFARQLNNLINPVFIVAAVIFVFVEGLLVVTMVKFRRRSDDDAPKQVHGNARLELFWTITPALILAAVGIGTLGTIFSISRKPAGNVLNVSVTGHQWWWEYKYPGLNVTTANELHIPAGRPVYITLTSKDVIHNFWPPKLAGKVYAIPGRTNHMSLEADKPGEYWGQCAEFCGMSHANMRLRVIAHTEADFEQWVKANEVSTPTVQLAAATSSSTATSSTGTSSGDPVTGQTLFTAKGCASCHSITGISNGQVGPNLTHLMQRHVFAGSIFDMNDLNLRKWLRNPPAEKPGSIMPNLNLSEDDITNLIAYLDTLK
jgi:cytochrome c oxidase subunit 2